MTAARQASLSITNSWSLFKLMSIESVMPSNHLILCHPLLLSPSIFPSISVFYNESVLHIRWPKYWRRSLVEAKDSENTHTHTYMVDPHHLWIYIGEFVYLLKCTFTLQINQCSHAFMVTYRHAEWWKLIPGCACSQRRLNKVTLSLSSCSSSHTINKYLFQGVLKCQNFSFSCAFDW